MEDFLSALEEVKAAFGASLDTFETYRTHGILSCGKTFDHLMSTLKSLVHQVGVCVVCPLLCVTLTSCVSRGRSNIARRPLC